MRNDMYKSISEHCVYQIRWYTRKRREMLKDEGEAACRKAIAKTCDDNKVELINAIITPISVEIIVVIPAWVAVDKFINKTKKNIKRELLTVYSSEVISEETLIWTEAFMVCTLGTPPALDEIRKYIESQRTSQRQRYGE